jgi:hypothetical protein
MLRPRRDSPFWTSISHCNGEGRERFLHAIRALTHRQNMRRITLATDARLGDDEGSLCVLILNGRPDFILGVQ